MKSVFLCGAIAVAAISAPAFAQIQTTGTLRPTVESEAAEPAPAPSQTGPVSPKSAGTTAEVKYMPGSTLLQVTPVQEITSKRIEEGQQVAFVTVGDVEENGVVVIPRGSPVVGTITWKTGRAIGGKSGKFEVRFDSVRVRGRSYALSGTYRQEGRGNTVGALLGSIIISGRSAVMGPGQVVNAFTAEPIEYRPA